MSFKFSPLSDEKGNIEGVVLFRRDVYGISSVWSNSSSRRRNFRRCGQISPASLMN